MIFLVAMWVVKSIHEYRNKSTELFHNVKFALLLLSLDNFITHHIGWE